MENSKKEKEVKVDLINPIDKDAEIMRLKRSINGYKGQIKILQSSTIVTDLQKEINDLEDVIKQKNDVIDELNNKVFDLQTSKDELANMLADAKDYAASLEATIENTSPSWWHRLFG